MRPEQQLAALNNRDAAIADLTAENKRLSQEAAGLRTQLADAQAKSLADERRIQELHTECEELFKQLNAERTRRLKAEDIVDTAERTANPGTALLHLAIQYRTQYPRVEEEPKRD